MFAPSHPPPAVRQALYLPFVMNSIIAKIEQEQIKKVAEFNVGDTVKVHTRVAEGDKERIQIFAGIVIARNGSGFNQSFTVRKISYGEGVERVFPLNTPKIAKVEVTKRGHVRRAKLHYLRKRIGKDAVTVRDSRDQVPTEGAAETAE